MSRFILFSPHRSSLSSPTLIADSRSTHSQRITPILYRSLTLMLFGLMLAISACGDDSEPEDDSNSQRPNASQNNDPNSPGDNSQNNEEPNPEEPPTPAKLGEACTASIPCENELSCIQRPGFSEGLCMEPCPEQGRICEDGSVCSPAQSGSNLCYAGGSKVFGDNCGSSLECGLGLNCIGLASGGSNRCLRACHTQDDVCEAHEFCSTFTGEDTGVCQPQVGARCMVTNDCTGGLQCTFEISPLLGLIFPLGYCTNICQTNAECPDETHCTIFEQGRPGVCLGTCESAADCSLLGDQRCIGAESCEGTAEEEACRASIGDAKVCLPNP